MLIGFTVFTPIKQLSHLKVPKQIPNPEDLKKSRLLSVNLNQHTLYTRRQNDLTFVPMNSKYLLLELGFSPKYLKSVK